MPGGKLAVFRSPARGDGPPLLCINGGLLYSHAIIWPALAPLSHGRQLVLYDQRGRGDSAEPSDPGAWTIDRDAMDVASLRTALGIRTWDIVGHSWGAGIAALAAEREGDLVRRLVLVDPVGSTSDWLPGLHDLALERLTGAERAALARQSPAALADPVPALHSAYSRVLYPAWFADAALARSFAPPRTGSCTGAAVAARLRREGYDWRERFRAVNASTLVVHGDRDLISCATSHLITNLIPKASLECIPGSGHMPFWEAPEIFFAAVQSFLARSR